MGPVLVPIYRPLPCRPSLTNYSRRSVRILDAEAISPSRRPAVAEEITAHVLLGAIDYQTIILVGPHGPRWEDGLLGLVAPY